jgi:hypothetical protein
MGDEAGREAAYRFLSNRRVSLGRVIEPHVDATVARCRSAGKVLVVSDTTEFKFSTDREGLGFLGSEEKRGFLGHFSIALTADGSRTPLGVLGIETLTRSVRKGPRDHFARKKDPDRESLRWQRCALAASDKLKGVQAVHVMDREADIYELLFALTKDGLGFIIRSSQNRLVEGGKLFEQMDWAPMRFRREVKLSARSGKRPPESKRSHPAREGRSADLSVSACRMSVQKPTSAIDGGLPDAIEINVVRVLEVSPPSGEDPVEWRLFTTEAIETQAQIEHIVDAYRARWVIEEYFKALKTGCNYERSQLESFGTIENFLGICAPVAWQLLLLRSTARDAPDEPATKVLSPKQINVLRLIAQKPLPPAPSVAHVMAAIAALGAHIKSNGPPGWQVLGRGFEQLLRAEDLHDRMISRGSYDQS